MRSMIRLACMLLMAAGVNATAQKLPDRPEPPRLVNDFANILNPSQAEALEKKLVDFNDSTSTQVTVVIVPDLQGMDKSEYAIELGNKWGVGQRGKNNGVLMLIKPKTADSRGEIFIASGYGSEGPLPDLRISDIINDNIIPHFRDGDYYAGIDAGVDAIIASFKGEYKAEPKSHGTKGNSPVPAIVIIIILFLIFMIGGRKSGNRPGHIASKGLPWWIMLAMMNSGPRSGSWGGFSSGGGFGGGGGGGGFGGFGGGSFGGGGAGGSW